MKIYYDREQALKNKLVCLGIDLDEKNLSNYVVYNSDELFKGYPIVDGDTLRAATTKELVELGKIQLTEGERLVDGEIVKIEKPSIYHKWVDGKWVVDLKELKLIKRDELKVIRDEKISEDIEVEGSWYQVRDQDLQKFFLKKIEVDLHPELRSKKEAWILADNTVKEIDFNDIEKVLAAYGNRQRELFYSFGLLLHQLEYAQNEEQIKEIQWS